MSGNKELKSNPQQKAVFQRTEIFQGPIPHPDILKQYAEIIPDAPERILHLAEMQTIHRQGLEKTVIEGDNRRADRGQRFGFIVAMTAIIGGFVLIGMGKNGYGIAAILGALASLVGSFIYSSETRKKERSTKITDAKKVS